MIEPIYEFKSPHGGTYKVQIKKGFYSNGRTALQLITPDGEPVLKVTCNIPEFELEPGEVYVKTWSENEGMAEFLAENKIADDTGKTGDAGWCQAPVMRLLI